MTIEFEKMSTRDFVADVVRIHKASVGSEPHLRNASVNKVQRDAEYAKVVEPLLDGCPHKWLLNIPELKKNRNEMLCHIADVAFRSATGIASEGALTLDDVLCISVAAFLRKRVDEYQSTSMFKHIYDFGISVEELTSIGLRFVKYQMSNLPEVYQNDNPEKLANVLMYQFSFGQTMKEYAASIGVDPRIAHDRIISLKAFERENLLAILYTSGHVELSIEKGSSAYNSNFTSLSRGKPFAPKPLV